MVCSTPVITGKIDEASLKKFENDSPDIELSKQIVKKKSLLVGMGKPENEEETKAPPK